MTGQYRSMTDEAAGSPGPATTGADGDEPTARLSSDGPGRGPVDAPPPPPDAGATPPPPDAGSPPPPPPDAGGGAPDGGGGPPPNAPPWFGTGSDTGISFTREQLVRPAQGRYVAGVCTALGRATNTDPVLWRVVVAVLGFIGGVGILLYLVGWLVIPGEGDTSSPLESLLGRGRSQMSPVSVILLALAAAVTFVLIVNDGLRAVLLGGAAVGGAVLIMRRSNAAKAAPGAPGGTTTAATPPTATPPTGAPPTGAPGATFPAPAYAAATPAPPAPAMAAGQPAPATAPAGQPMTGQAAATPWPAAPWPTATPGAGMPPGPAFAPPPGTGYRPPFAPHGPWGNPPPHGQGFPAGQQQPPRPPRPPKPPRERSPLGRMTFFLILVAIGIVALLDLNGVAVQLSTYFAAALATIAAGLLVGSWFGRARGLIALGVLATIGLAVSSAGERWGAPMRETEWRPLTVSAIADRYETPVGDATLDLRAVDFTGAQQATTVKMGGGRLIVMLPPTVDVTATVAVDHGRVRLFGREWNGTELGQQEVRNLGVDGSGGGGLRLDLDVTMGDVEVVR